MRQQLQARLRVAVVPPLTAEARERVGRAVGAHPRSEGVEGVAAQNVPAAVHAHGHVPLRVEGVKRGAAGGRVPAHQSRRPECVDGGDVAGRVHLDHGGVAIVEEVRAHPARRLLPGPQAVPECKYIDFGVVSIKLAFNHWDVINYRYRRSA